MSQCVFIINKYVNDLIADLICSLITRIKTRRRCHMVASHVFSVTPAEVSCQSHPFDPVHKSTAERLAGPFSMWRTIHSLIEHGVILSKRDTRTRTRQPPPSTFSVDVPHVPHVPHRALNQGFHHTRTSKLQAEAERWRQKSARCETVRMCRRPRTVCANLRISAHWNCKQKKPLKGFFFFW